MGAKSQVSRTHIKEIGVIEILVLIPIDIASKTTKFTERENY